ncbi:hypothetical protein OG689_43340 [Kitasatospora sp. NBC_00240]|uniref:nSTAND1 domain-containing NTPase n=1 Tax=Kitasatospora sp. NBC_00240 TaxID=2903567 RepID=UPI00224EA96B|nr:hypothetical protein [Kitasatospora sp. NBC_00240]MCX5215976.1 hypothetical protein [Kitasatospora sp. NBC_00240]
MTEGPTPPPSDEVEPWQPRHIEAHVTHGDAILAGRDVNIRYEDGTRRTLPGPGADDDPPCPYPGLKSFTAQHARWFYGRDRMVAAVCARLADQVDDGGLLCVIGASGTGKSSLLSGGVLPAIAEGALPAGGSRWWPRITLTPTAAPAEALAAAVRIPPEEVILRTAAWRADPGQCVADLRRVAGPGPGTSGTVQVPSAGLVMVMDQFEETFTQCLDDAERRWFIEVLERLGRKAAPGEPTVLVVLGVRADFYAACTAYPQLHKALADDPVLITPMTETELRQAIRLPARDVGLEIEDGLVEVLLSELGAAGQAADAVDGWEGAGQAGRLPFLAHALRATWQARSGHIMTLDGYRVTGGIQKAIEHTADQLFKSLPEGGGEAAKSVFLRLVVVGRDADDVRRRVDYQQLLRESPDPALAKEVVDVFTEGRLLTKDEEFVAITHEALIRAWPLLSSWIGHDRAGNLVRQDLEEAARAWDEASREPTSLYGGNRRAAADAWVEKHPGEISATAQAFLLAADRRERRAVRVRRRVISALSVLLTAALGATGIAVTQTFRAQDSAAAALRERDQAIYAQVTAEALQLMDSDPSLGAQLALAAYRMKPNPDAASRLISTENTPLATRLRSPSGPQGSVYTVAYSPDGHTLATGSVYENTVRLWDITDPGRPRLLVPELPQDSSVDSILSLQFSPDGKTLAVAGHVGNHDRGSWAGGGFVDLWNVSSPSRPVALGRPVTTDLSAIQTLDFSPDGHTLAVGSADWTVTLWNVTRPGAVTSLGQVLTGPGSAVYSVEFSPDGHTLAAAGADGSVTLWNVTRPETVIPLGQAQTASDQDATDVAFSPDGHTLAVGSADSTVHLWNVTDPSRPTSLGQNLAGPANSVMSVAFSPDGHTLAASSADNTVHLWNVTLPSRPSPLGRPLTGPSQPALSVAFSPDGRTLAVGNADGATDLWSLPATLLAGDGGNVEAAAFSPDGRTLAAGNQNGTISLWSTTDPNHPAPLGPPLPNSTQPALSVAFSPDGHTLAAGSKAGEVTLWNLTDPQHPKPLGQPLQRLGGSVHTVVFSPDGHTLAAAGDAPISGDILLWDVSDPSRPTDETTVFGDDTTHSVLSLAFSPDGNVLAAGGDNSNHTVGLWRVGREDSPVRMGQPLEQPGSTSAWVAFSPDGRTLAVGNSSGTINLLNTTDPHHPTPRGEPLLLPGPLWSVAFSPDGHTLVASGQTGNGTISRWNVTNPDHPEPIGQPLTVTTGPVAIVAFSPNSRILAATTDDGVVGLWNLTTDEAIHRICETSASALSPQQWNRYIPQLPYTPPCPATTAANTTAATPPASSQAAK